MTTLEIILILLFFAAILVSIAQKIKVPYPIGLVVGGALISFLPHHKQIEFDPNLILVVVLPPILYYASFALSFQEFKRNIKEISALALGLVILTTLLIGFLFKWLFPEFSWPLSFAFGAIVSPPDSIATTTIMKRFAISPRLLAIIEGESLINDASALVLYKLAVAAILSGVFTFSGASLEFLKIVSGGIVIGATLGYCLQTLSRKYFSPAIAVLFSFTIPYIVYITADRLSFSGVLAVVTTGLIGSRMVFRHHSSLRRILGFAVWDIFTILMNCFVFILIGLQLKRLTKVMTWADIGRSTLSAVLITCALILIRFFWVFTKGTIDYWKAKRHPKKMTSQRPFFRESTIIGWAGMRGIVSLAAVLALPYTLSNGMPLQGRDEIIFITFVVILLTLLIPSSTLSYLIRRLGLDQGADHKKAHQARKHLVHVAEEKIRHLHEGKKISEREFDFLSRYFGLQRYVFEIATSPLKKMSNLEKARLDVFKTQRKALLTMWEKQEIDDKLFVQLEHELDVEESHMQRAELK
jgi:Na+/H+ antiporter